MKNIPLSFLIIMGLFATGQLTAQDVPATEVDRILSEIETETPAVEEAVTEAVVEDPVVEEAGAEMVEETVTVEPVEVADPTTVPAINLEEVVDVEGLEIRGSDSGTQGLITLSYEDVKLADMVRIFAQTSGANIIIPEGMDELVSGNLNDVFWLEALEVILGDKGYVLVARKSDIYTISSRDQMATEPLASETLDLQFITAEAALPAIQSMIVSSNASVTPIPQTNVLIISETPERIQEIKRLVKLVDRPRRQVFIEAKFVELNDSAIKDLGINWQVLQGYTVRATGLTSEYERTDTRSTQDAQALLTTRQNAGSRTNNFIDPLLNTDISTSSQNQLNALVQGKNFDTISATTGAITTVPSMEEMVTKNAILSADDFALTLSALQQLDGTRIVSNPKMLVANGETATIHVGRNEPNVRAIPQGDNASSYAYVLDGFIEIGVKLEVTPIISTDKNITISIIPELSRLIG
jgi:type IV pilus assembly protein PilQ